MILRLLEIEQDHKADAYSIQRSNQIKLALQASFTVMPVYSNNLIMYK